MKFVRVLTGVALPQVDRQAAAVVALGELHRSFAPSDFTGLGAAVGTWPEMKQALMQFCHALKPDHIVVGSKDNQKQIWPVTDALVGIKPLPLSSVAPDYALTEIGRQHVDELINENRLHITHLMDVMNSEFKQSDAALRYAVNYALEFPAFYPGKKRG